MFSSWGHTFLIIKVSFHSLWRLCVTLVSRPLRSWVSDTTSTFCTLFPQFHDRPPIPLDVLDLKWHRMAILDEISGVAWRTLKPYVCLSRVNQYNGTVCNLGRTHVTSWLAFFSLALSDGSLRIFVRTNCPCLPPRKNISKQSHWWQHQRVGPVKVPRVLCEIPYRRSRFNKIETYDCSICKVLGLVVVVTLSVLLAHR